MVDQSSPPPSLRSAFDTPDHKRRYVRRLFHTIAPRYDLITVVLSYGQDRRWKRRVIALAKPGSGDAVLDLACGTGDLARLAAAEGAAVVGLDLTWRMVELARAKPPTPAGRVAWLVGDMTLLPFADRTFVLITTGYCLRNVPVLAEALREIHRVLRPGGRVWALDFNRPASAVVRFGYLVYLTLAGSALGLLLHADADTYRYIPESIRRYPGAAGVALAMRRTGFAQADWIPALGGLMALNWGIK